MNNTKSCAFCKKMFSSVGVFNRHIKTVHLNLSGSCLLCGETFESQTIQKLHLIQCARHHQNGQEQPLNRKQLLPQEQQPQNHHQHQQLPAQQKQIQHHEKLIEQLQLQIRDLQEHNKEQQ